MTQRTLKHRDWVKIIDNRHQQITAKPKKQPKIVAKCTIFAAAALITGLIYNELNNPQQLTQLTIQQQQNIQQHFSRKLTLGNWQFSHADFKDNQIKIYINLPNSLALKEPVLTSYIQQTLCPAKSERLWRIIEHRRLIIHMFTGSSIRTGYTVECIAHEH
ncbi:hypothetical protein [Pseudoalteromonas sp. B160]|uniref:hypothetical protein n=1 Tax=Pseudoalteromonas sp. B160 TaxID=630414 RepID=UPI00301DD64A